MATHRMSSRTWARSSALTTTVFPADEVCGVSCAPQAARATGRPAARDRRLGVRHARSRSICLESTPLIRAPASSPDKVVPIRRGRGHRESIRSRSGRRRTRRYGATWRGRRQDREGRHVHPSVSFVRVPRRHRQILENLALETGMLADLVTAGGLGSIRPDANGCIGIGQCAGEDGAASARRPRNFPGPQRMKDDKVYL